jgi:thioredoxin-like negative regulator of GroEL
VEEASLVTVLTSANYDTVINDPANSVLLLFSVPWCQPCKELMQTLQSVAKVFAAEDNIIVAVTNAEDEPEIALKNDVSSYPAIKVGW